MSDVLNIKSPLAVPRDGREITQSAIGTFDTCKRKFHLQTNERLDPMVTARPLRIGDLWHTVMAAHYKDIAARQGGLSFESSSPAGTDPLAEVRAWYSQSEQHDAEELRDLVMAMYATHCTTFPIEQDMARFRILGVEVTLKSRILTPTGRPSPWFLVGTIDVLAYDNIAKSPVVIDHKSTSLSRDQHVPNLDLSFQGQDYMALASDALQIPVRHVIFQAARKKPLSSPEILKTTGMPSTTRTPDTTLAKFDKAIVDARGALTSAPEPNFLLEAAGDAREAEKLRKAHEKAKEKGLAISIDEYAEIRTTLANREDRDGNAFVWRKHAIVPDEYIRRFWIDAYVKTKDIAEERRWTMSRGACEPIGMGPCPYRPLCVYGDGALTRQSFNRRPEGSFLPSLKKSIISEE